MTDWSVTLSMSLDKRQRITEAAVRLFRKREFHEITLDEVATEADVGKGTIYLYFSDKNDLFFQTAVAGFDELCERLRASAAEGASFRDRLVQTCQTISDFFRKRRPLFRMIMSEGERALGRGASLRQRWLERRKKMTAIVTEIVAHGVESGDVRADVPAEILTEYLLGLLRTRSWELEDQPESLRTLGSVVDLFINGAAGQACATRRQA
jgi:TetR/AcrR family fatty acid metabolism transcriptional regulator